MEMLKDNEITIKYQPTSDEYEGPGVVCFLDLLGFSHSVKSKWKNDRKSILGIIDFKKKLIESTQQAMGAGLIGNQNEITFYTSNFRMISDSIILLTNIPENINSPDYKMRIYSIMHTAMSIWTECLKNGFTLRGGIEYGEVYWDKENVLGPALIDAYSLESKHAKTSRIICGDNFINILANIENRTKPPLDSVHDCLIFDIDGMLCLNPVLLNKYASAGRGNEEDGQTRVLEWLKQMMHGVTSEYVKQKYLTLQKIISKPDIVKKPTLKEMINYSLKLNN